LGPCACQVGALPLESCPQSFLILLFSNGIHIYAQVVLYSNPIYATHVAGMIYVHPHTFLSLGEMGFGELSAQVSSNGEPLDLLLNC
jgi:hypothetical protein